MSAIDTDGKPLGRNADIVDLVICVCSGVGALIIIVPYVASKHSRKLRHSLILGLATADLVSNLTIIASTAYLVNGGDFETGDTPRACTFLGFALSSGLYAQHMWNLAILAVTYMILVHPLSDATLMLERRVIYLYPIIWTLALTLNIIPWVRAGFAYSNGYCYIGLGAGPAFPSLFQLIPRCIVVSTVLILYTRLFLFLRRTNFFKKKGDGSQDETSTHSSAFGRDAELALKDQSSRPKGLPSNSDEEAHARLYLPSVREESLAEKSGVAGSGTSSDDRKSGSRAGNTPDMELQDYGFLNSPTATPLTAFNGRELPPSPTSGQAAPPLIYSGGPQQQQPQAGSLLLSPSPVSYRADDGPSTSHRRGSSATGIDRRGAPGLSDDDVEDDDDDSIPDYHSWAGLKARRSPRDARDFNMTSAPQEGVNASLPALQATTSVLEALRSGPTVSGKAADIFGDLDESSDKKGALRGLRDEGPVVDRKRTDPQPTYDAALDDSFAWGQNVTAADSGKRKTAGKDGLTSGISHTDGSGVENIGSTLNRQASALLLLYPLAYVILFSVSVIRICRDLAHPDISRNPNDPLRAISRWLVFAQGALDCIIFKVIEYQFRRRMRRKRARALGEDSHDSSQQQQSQTLGARFKQTCRRIWSRHIRVKPESSRRASLGE